MTYKIKRPKEKEGKSFEIKKKKKDPKKVFLEDIKKKGTITERELLLVKRRLNHGTYKQEDVSELYDLEITPEQTTKGLSWLKNKGWTPKGKERKNNPYGYREEDALKSFERFKFMGFHNDSNYQQSQMGVNNYVPIYRVEGKEGNFEYFVKGGEPYIWG